VRYSVEIPSKLDSVFKQIAGEEQISQSELMRKALLTYAVLHKSVLDGKSISIINDGKIEKEIVLCL